MSRVLVIISATPATFSIEQARYCLFEPTLREIESASALFDKIIWYGFPNGVANSNLYRVPNTDKIIVKVFPNVIGGKTVWQKVTILPWLPFLIVKIGYLVWHYDYIHTRGPSLPALIAIAFSRIFSKKKIWHKYAGNWNQPDPPASYRVQLHWLKKSHHPVTVNGQWHEQNPQIHSFENPCFSGEELREASVIVRSYDGRELTIAFVGRLENEKGVHLVIEAAKQLPATFHWLIVGEGNDKERMQQLAHLHPNITFTGALSRTELRKVYKQSHVVILPSASEGFPKVISEACGFGCIPIVSNVSAMSQYIQPEFGCLLNKLDVTEIVKTVKLLQQKDQLTMAAKAIQFAQLFTYERFVKRIREEIFAGHV